MKLNQYSQLKKLRAAFYNLKQIKSDRADRNIRPVFSGKGEISLGYIYLAVAIACELLGTTFLKYSEGFTKLLPSLISITAYGICFFFFSKSMQDINLSVAYATWSALGLVITTFISFAVFKEGITPAGIAGLILIVAGVIILNLLGTPAKS